MPRVVPSQIVYYIDSLRKNTTNLLGLKKEVQVTTSTIGYLNGLLRLIDELPDEYLTIDGKEYCDFVLATTSIANVTKTWRPGGNIPYGKVPPVQGVDVLHIIHMALEKCSDTVAASSTTALPFIAEKEIRDSIRVDLSSATSAVHNAEWKAATVLAGSVCEALLLWAIPKTTDFKPEEIKSVVGKKVSLERLDLTGFIKLAVHVKIITVGTSIIANRARDYRNLIHPGRAERTKHACDRATALAALAAAESIIRNLKMAASHPNSFRLTEAQLEGDQG